MLLKLLNNCEIITYVLFYWKVIVTPLKRETATKISLKGLWESMCGGIPPPGS
jgi:hypothetical protein